MAVVLVKSHKIHRHVGKSPPVCDRLAPGSLSFRAPHTNLRLVDDVRKEGRAWRVRNSKDQDRAIKMKDNIFKYIKE